MQAQTQTLVSSPQDAYKENIEFTEEEKVFVAFSKKVYIRPKIFLMRKKTNFEGEQTVGEFLLLPFVAPAA